VELLEEEEDTQNPPTVEIWQGNESSKSWIQVVPEVRHLLPLRLPPGFPPLKDRLERASSASAPDHLPESSPKKPLRRGRWQDPHPTNTARTARLALVKMRGGAHFVMYGDIWGEPEERKKRNKSSRV